ncbi:biotin--[acetyl-CoA-carboxylase] ligase [Candidatus Riesia pediculicola]|uniref:biotin--[acetyl-CoA-carboxylase] ligase n=1 Tax=Candidatus Riesia pediculicola TaxID=401619 RepID=UPI0009C2FB1B|nr:biotin--[acetyl-CoA-carboxylase] ligase [Candidatus Riesia pediculicola]ARC54324.1 hypothetical protein AOE57_01860 [Candidatus Riesia pediculicola]
MFQKKLYILDIQKIQESVKHVNIFIRDTVDSTNQCLKRMIHRLRTGDVFLAEHQTRGFGRRGKKWFSSPGNSICLSLYWKFRINLNFINAISLAIGISVTKVLNELYDCKIILKRPNDLYIQNRKVGGILIETTSILKEEVHCIIGIGINLSENDTFHQKIKKSWTTLQKTIGRVECNQIVSAIIRETHRTLVMFEKNHHLFNDRHFELRENTRIYRE